MGLAGVRWRKSDLDRVRVAERDDDEDDNVVELIAPVVALLHEAGREDVLETCVTSHGQPWILVSRELREAIYTAVEHVQFVAEDHSPPAQSVEAARVLDVPVLKSAERVFGFFERLIPGRNTREELGDAREELARLVASGASKWHCRAIICRAVAWRVWNFIREVVPLFAAILAFRSHC